MEIIISNSSGVPIYEQIYTQIKAQIIAGELEENEVLPSIRALARDLRCSVITTKNAYEELVKGGYIINVPSKGFYVAKVDREVVREELLSRIEVLLDEAVEIAKTNHIDKKTLFTIIKILYEEKK